MSVETMNLIVATVVVPLLGAITTFIIAWINAKTTQIKQKTSSDRLKDYLDIAEKAVASAVTAVSQTYVDTLKKGDAFTIENQKEAFKMARTKALAIMGAEALTALKAELKSAEFDIWIDTKIEEYVKLSK